MTSQKTLTYIRAIQGRSGGITIASDLMGYVLLPQGWKEFMYHKGCSCNIKSILEHGLVAGRKQSREGVQTVFFSPLNPCGQVPRKFHYCSKWRHDQDAAYWIKLKRAQDWGLQFWQTRSYAILVHNPMHLNASLRLLPEMDKK